MAKKFTAIGLLQVRAAADSIEHAVNLRNKRIDEANRTIQAGGDPTTIPGVYWEGWDPGGGPCRPAFRKSNLPVDQSGLPEAVSRDDD